MKGFCNIPLGTLITQNLGSRFSRSTIKFTFLRTFSISTYEKRDANDLEIFDLYCISLKTVEVF